MDTTERRYIFTSYTDLTKVKIKKLEKVSQRVFIVVDKRENSIPIKLVKDLQRIGKGVKWIEIDDLDEKSFANYLCFIIGRLHEKAPADIEFAIITDDKSLDSVCKSITLLGRNCVRVGLSKGSSSHANSIGDEGDKESRHYWSEEKIQLESEQYETREFRPSVSEPANKQEANPTITATRVSRPSAVQTLPNTVFGKKSIEETADETIKRLIRSGVRPTEIEHLRSYILLHNQELASESNVDKVIQHMVEQQEIEISKNEITYFF